MQINFLPCSLSAKVSSFIPLDVICALFFVLDSENHYIHYRVHISSEWNGFSPLFFYIGNKMIFIKRGVEDKQNNRRAMGQGVFMPLKRIKQKAFNPI